MERRIRLQQIQLLRIILFENLPPLAHPGPPPVGIDGGIGLESPATPGKFDDYSTDIPGVLERHV